MQTASSESAMPDGVWVPMADIARRNGVSRAAIKKRVDRLESQGLITTRPGDKGVRLVDLAAFDKATNYAGDAVKEAAAETARGNRGGAQDDGRNAALRDAQTQKAQYEARRISLDLAERTGRIVPVKGEHGVEAATIRAAEAIVRQLDRIPAWSTDLVAEAKDGPAAVRRMLKEKAAKLRKVIAEELAKVAADGAATEADGGYEFELEGEE